MEWQGEGQEFIVLTLLMREPELTDLGSHLPSVTEPHGSKAGSRTQASWAPVSVESSSCTGYQGPLTEERRAVCMHWAPGPHLAHLATAGGC